MSAHRARIVVVVVVSRLVGGLWWIGLDEEREEQRTSGLRESVLGHVVRETGACMAHLSVGSNISSSVPLLSTAEAGAGGRRFSVRAFTGVLIAGPGWIDAGIRMSPFAPYLG